MKFQDLITNTTTKRNELKPFFNTGETPTQKNFHDLIDGLFLIQGNGLFKDDQNGLSIQTSTEDLTKTALLFYDAPDEEPVWTMSTLDGFHLKDVANNARLSVLNDGKVGIGTATPDALLQVGDPTTNIGGKHNIRLGKYVSVGESGGGLSTIIGNNVKASETEDNKSVYLNNTDPGQMIRLNYTYGLSFHTSTQAGTAGAEYDELANERMRITTDGNVGIGITTPNAKLDLKGKFRISDANTTESLDAYYQNADVNETKFNNVYPEQHERAVMFKPNAYLDGSGAGGAGYQFWTHGITGGTFPNYTSGHIQSMVIRRDGRVGIGTPSPAEKLNLYNGNLRMDNGFIRFENTPSNASGITGYNLVFYRDNTYYNYNTGFGQSSNKDVWFNVHEGSFKFLWANSDRLTINLRSNTSAYYVIDANGKIASSDGTLYSSDERYKKDIETITPNMLGKLEQVRGATFKWRTDEFEHKNFSEGTKMGFIAQELKEVFPDLVNEGADGYYSINYTGLIPLLVEAVKDLNQKNQALEERVAKLEN
ncbi:MAG TPA: hypothetical protein DCS93_36590 [Microscillaceae bacterium]|nr:hypothetical protein [Microscillaceae bacterium]